MHFRLGKLINSASKEGAPNTLQKEPEPSTEQVDEDIIQQINPASTKDENKDALNGELACSCVARLLYFCSNGGGENCRPHPRSGHVRPV